MEKSRFYINPPIREKRALTHLDRIWDFYVPAYRVAPHMYSVGANTDVCAYLLDSGEGLILIDTAMRETMYLMIHNIWSLGYDPRDIKLILLSHWHGDHVNGVRMLKELTGAKVYISREDEVMHQLHANDTHPMPTLPYTVDAFYDEDKPITLGRFTIRTRLTPGHTVGATSFFFEDQDDETGEVFRCAMHGGMGTDPMKPEALAKAGLSEEVAHKFVRDCLELKEVPVDLCTPSHMDQGDIENNMPEDLMNYRHFYAPEAWGQLMQNRADTVMDYYPQYYPVK